MISLVQRRTSRRTILSAGAGSGGVVLLAACGQAGSTQPGGQSSAGAAKGKVTFMSQGAAASDEPRYKPILDEYNARKGPVTIEMIEGGGGATDQQGKLITLVVAGTPPDAVWTHANISPTLVKVNLVAPLDPYLKNDKDIKLANYFDAPIKNYEANGNHYGIPREATTIILIVNKELFQKNGVALPNDNWTWDDYLKAAQQMTKSTAGGQTWGASGWGGKGADYYVPYVKVWSEGGDIVDATRTKFTLHQTPAVDQIQWLADLVFKFKVHTNNDDYPGNTRKDAWSTGRIGMIAYIPVITDFKDAAFDWDFYALPKGSKGRSTRTASAGHSMVAPSKNKDAAWEIIKVLGSKAAYENWAKVGLNIPAHKEVANSPLVVNPSQPPKSFKAALDAFSYARPEPIAGDWGSVGGEISKAFGDIFAGKSDAKSTLTAIVPVVESFLGKTPAMVAATPAK